MKKILLYSLVAVLFTACGDYTTETHTQYYEIQQNDWVRANDGRGQFLYFYCTFPEPLLTNTILKRYASLNAYLYYYVQGEGDTFSPLPYSDFFIDQSGTPWQGLLSVEYQEGYIVFNLKINDLQPVIPRSVYKIMVSIPKNY